MLSVLLAISVAQWVLDTSGIVFTWVGRAWDKSWNKKKYGKLIKTNIGAKNGAAAPEQAQGAHNVTSHTSWSISSRSQTCYDLKPNAPRIECPVHIRIISLVRSKLWTSLIFRPWSEYQTIKYSIFMDIWITDSPSNGRK